MTVAEPAPVTLLCGPAGAGKTSYASRMEAAGATVLSFDREAWRLGGEVTRELMLEVEQLLLARLADALAAGERVVIEGSMSTRQVRQQWRERIEALGAECELVVLRAPSSVLHERVRDRIAGPDSVRLSAAELDRFLAGFEWPGEDEPHSLVETG